MSNREIINELIRQIGPMTMLAASGGRYRRLSDTVLSLPVGSGYSVEVEYDTGWDDYTVRRVFTRGGKRWVKGETVHLYCDDIGEATYRASCFHHPFGDELNQEREVNGWWVHQKGTRTWVLDPNGDERDHREWPDQLAAEHYLDNYQPPAEKEATS